MIEGKNALDSARNAFSEAGMSLVDDPVSRITGKKRKAPGNQGGKSKKRGDVTVHQADHGDMLFQSGQLRIKNTATEYIDSYGVLGYIRNLLGMMPDAKKTRLECKGWFEDNARGVEVGTNATAEKERRKKIAGSRKQFPLLKPKLSVKFEFLYRRSPTTTYLNVANVEVVACKIRVHSAEL